MCELANILEFLKIVEKLGVIKRDTLFTNGKFESDSAHILKLCYLTQVVAPFLKTPVDAHKMLELALVHDLVEAECGDVPLCAQSGDNAVRELKFQNEKAAIERYRSMLPAKLGDKIYNLFMEYEHKTSREAQVVYVLDKLDANFQACRFGDGDVRYWADGENGEWYYRSAMNDESREKTMLSKLQEPLLDGLESLAMTTCRNSIKKSGIVVEGDFPTIEYHPNPLAEQIIAFMDEIEKLCLITRDNLLTDGSQETDADHIVKLCYLVMLVTPSLEKSVDYQKMLKIALVHDLVEAKSGDFSLSAQAESPELRQLKKQVELQSIEYFRSILPSPVSAEIYDLFMEYEERQSQEAKIVGALDKLESVMTANLYHEGDIRYWAKCPNGSWYYKNGITPRTQVAVVNEPVITRLEEILIKLTSENIEKFGIRIPV